MSHRTSYNIPGQAHFLTFSCWQRQPFLSDSAACVSLAKTLHEARQRERFGIWAYVLMPEHVHLVLHPQKTLRLGPVIGELKPKSASRIIAEGLITLPAKCRVVKDGRERWIFWQPRCYDHNCRTTQTVIEKINYGHNNPVVRKLVGEPGQWQWSSFNWYAGQTDVPLEMDEFY